MGGMKKSVKALEGPKVAADDKAAAGGFDYSKYTGGAKGGDKKKGGAGGFDFSKYTGGAKGGDKKQGGAGGFDFSKYTSKYTGGAKKTDAAAEYEKPPCASGEDAVQVQGLSGDFCSPKCSASKACPALPAGVTGKAQCILQTAGSSGPTNCAIICSPTKGLADQCPKGASCEAIQGTGICMYPQSALALVNLVGVRMSEKAIEAKPEAFDFSKYTKGGKGGFDFTKYTKGGGKKGGKGGFDYSKFTK